MICFRDMTFCSSDCTNTACHRHFGADDKAAAKPKLTPEQAKAELERRRANKKQGK